jgi:hypothetical protein
VPKIQGARVSAAGGITYHRLDVDVGTELLPLAAACGCKYHMIYCRCTQRGEMVSRARYSNGRYTFLGPCRWRKQARAAQAVSAWSAPAQRDALRPANSGQIPTFSTVQLHRLLSKDPINPIFIGSDCKRVVSRLVFLWQPLFPRLKSAECHLVSDSRWEGLGYGVERPCVMRPHGGRRYWDCCPEHELGIR